MKTYLRTTEFTFSWCHVCDVFLAIYCIKTVIIVKEHQDGVSLPTATNPIKNNLRKLIPTNLNLKSLNQLIRYLDSSSCCINVIGALDSPYNKRTSKPSIVENHKSALYLTKEPREIGDKTDEPTIDVGTKLARWLV